MTGPEITLVVLHFYFQLLTSYLSLPSTSPPSPPIRLGEDTCMILVTRLDGTSLILNAECIQSIENTPDTLITLTTGMTIMVREPVESIVSRFLDYKRKSLIDKIVTGSESERNNA